MRLRRHGFQIFEGRWDWPAGEWMWNLGWEPRDLWVGAFWTADSSSWIHDPEKTRRTVFSIYICLLPTLVFAFHRIKYHPR